MGTSTVSLVSSCSSSSDKSGKTPDSSPFPSFPPSKHHPSRLRLRKPHIRIPWSQKDSFVKLPKDEMQLDAAPLHFHNNTTTSTNTNSNIHCINNTDATNDANINEKTTTTPRHLQRQEKHLRAREAKLREREDAVRVREHRVWEGLREVARGRVRAAVLEARVRELEEEGVVGGGGEKGGDGSAGSEPGRQWWVKGWWSFRE